MVRLLYARISELPSAEEMQKQIPREWLEEYIRVHRRLSGQGLGWMYLAARENPLGRLHYSENRRPSFLGGAWEDVSVSHTDGGVYVAFSAGAHSRVGVDAEDGGRLEGDSLERIAERFFSPWEKILLEKEGGTRDAFLKIWTEKEALLKYRGEGLNRLSAADSAREGNAVFFRRLQIREDFVSICTETPLKDREFFLENREKMCKRD